VFSVNHRRTSCYIADVVELIVRMLESAACSGEVLNVDNETPEITIGELARIILDTVGRDAEIAPMPETAGSPLRRGPDMSKAAKLVSYHAHVDVQERRAANLRMVPG